MKINSTRLIPAFKAMTAHFGLSLLVAAIVAFLVFTLWFPYPYRELAGGRELFILVMAVDIVCGPLLTFVLFSPTKPKLELITDISLIAVIQILALCYGIWTVYQIRPLFVVQEADRLNIISRASIDLNELDKLPSELKSVHFGKPINVSLRELTNIEREKLKTEIEAKGHDSSEHPLFYVKYEGAKAYANGHSLKDLQRIHPELRKQIDSIASASPHRNVDQLRYLYIVGRSYWIVVINPAGEIVGFIQNQI
jgi:hypothetical protein